MRRDAAIEQNCYAFASTATFGDGLDVVAAAMDAVEDFGFVGCVMEGSDRTKTRRLRQDGMSC